MTLLIKTINDYLSGKTRKLWQAPLFLGKITTPDRPNNNNPHISMAKAR
jgi:hypothetical protein